MIAWFICPYDTIIRDGEAERVPSPIRYIPSVPNALGADFDEVEICGNHILAKIEAPQSVIDAMAADPDFYRIPKAATTIPQALRSRIALKLGSLGYDVADVDATSWSVDKLLDLLPKWVSEISLTADKQTVLVGVKRRLIGGKDIAMMDRRVRG